MSSDIDNELAQDTAPQEASQRLPKASGRSVRKRQRSIRSKIPGSTNSFFGFIQKELKSKLGVSIVVFILGGFTTVATGLWETINERADARIRRAVESDIKQKNDSKLLKIISDIFAEEMTNPKSNIYSYATKVFSSTFSEMLSSNVGALATGEFELNKSHPANVIHVFLPPESSVKLVLKVPELRSNEKVVILSSEGRRRKITQSGIYDINVVDLINSSTDLQTGISQELFKQEADDNAGDIKRVEGLFSHVHTLRVQLASGSDIDTENAANRDRRVVVQYFLAVTPLINLGRVK